LHARFADVVAQAGMPTGKDRWMELKSGRNSILLGTSFVLLSLPGHVHLFCFLFVLYETYFTLLTPLPPQFRQAEAAEAVQEGERRGEAAEAAAFGEAEEEGEEAAGGRRRGWRTGAGRSRGGERQVRGLSLWLWLWVSV
jgi:hypothetical protein